MNIEFIITIITIIAGFLGIIKFLIDLTNRVTKLEVELGNKINNLAIEIVKLQYQFGIVETKQADSHGLFPAKMLRGTPLCICFKV